MNSSEYHIGFDDIDDPSGRCTTHFATHLVELLNKHSVDWLDYPNLIRLNPGIPFRTRGNGAVSLRFKSTSDTISNLIPHIESMIIDYVDQTYANTNPGFVVIPGKMDEEVLGFSKRALWRTIPIALAKRIVLHNKYTHISLGSGRGLVGALAAVGNPLSNDYTYEYLAYRDMNDTKQERGVDVDSVIAMDQAMGDRVFSNIDDKQRILIEPHGPDPVLFGIRGETADAVIEAASLVKSVQNIDRWMVFRTNQATGEHLSHQVRIRDLRPHMAVQVQGHIETSPQIFEGGFVIFTLKDATGKIDCAAYEPTRQFRDIVTHLRIGDEIKVHASVRPKSRTHGRTLNLEGLEILHLSPHLTYQNPLCPKCGKRMKSAGTGKGFKCVHCSHRDSEVTKIEKEIERAIEIGLHLPPLSAQRHLTRPLSRQNMSNSGRPHDLVRTWYHF